MEVDEMYYGGKRKRGAGGSRRADRDQKNALWLAAVERKGRVVARVVPDSTRETLHG